MSTQKAQFRIAGEVYEFKEITIRKFYELQDLLMIQDKQTEYKIVECLTDCPMETLMKIKFSEWGIIWDEAQLQIIAMSGKTQDIKPTIDFQGKEYGLPQVDNITVGEFADLDIIISSGDVNRKLVEIAAILYRPIINKNGDVYKLEEYDSGGYKSRCELFKDLPLSAIKSANSFFLQYVNSSLKSTVESLLQMEEMKMLPQKDQEALQKLLLLDLGGGSSIPWLEKILLELKKLKSYRSEPLSTGLLGKKMKPQKKNWLTRNK